QATALLGYLTRLAPAPGVDACLWSSRQPGGWQLVQCRRATAGQHCCWWTGLSGEHRRPEFRCPSVMGAMQRFLADSRYDDGSAQHCWCRRFLPELVPTLLPDESDPGSV